MEPPINLTVEECLKHPLLSRMARDIDTEHWHTLRCVADILFDKGQQAMGEAYRWFADYRAIPYFHNGCWCWRRIRGERWIINCCLPAGWMNWVKARRSPAVERWYAFDSMSEAYWEAALAYAECGEPHLPSAMDGE